MPSVMVVDSPPGMTSASMPSRSAAVRTSRAVAPRRSSTRACASKSPWIARTPTVGISAASGLPAAVLEESALGSMASMPIPVMGAPRSREAAAIRSASSKWVVASTTAAPVRSGSSDLKMPEPTNTPSAPRRIISAASAGVATPPAENMTTGSRPFSATSRTRSSGACRSLAAAASSASSSEPSRRISPPMARMWRTASTTLPVPASPLLRIIAAPSAIRRSASPRSVAPHTNGTLNPHLSMWWASSAGVSTSDSSM